MKALGFLLMTCFFYNTGINKQVNALHNNTAATDVKKQQL